MGDLLFFGALVSLLFLPNLYSCLFAQTEKDVEHFDQASVETTFDQKTNVPFDKPTMGQGWSITKTVTYQPPATLVPSNAQENSSTYKIEARHNRDMTQHVSANDANVNRFAYKAPPESLEEVSNDVNVNVSRDEFIPHFGQRN